MLTPIQALRTSADAEALPRVHELEALYDYGFVPRRGQLLLVFGESGALKSFFAQWYVSRMNVAGLVFSPDNDAHTAIARLCAERSGYTTDSIIQALEAQAIGYVEDFLTDSKIQFCFDPSPTLDDIADELAAYVELWDRYPEVILVDNLVNVESYSEDEWSGMRGIMREFHRMARETGAAVIVLSHAQELGKPTECPPKRALQGKVSQFPERILSVAFDPSEMCFKLSPVKNRGGKSDSSGGLFVRLRAHPDRATFSQWIGAPRYDNSSD